MRISVLPMLSMCAVVIVTACGEDPLPTALHPTQIAATKSPQPNAVIPNSYVVIFQKSAAPNGPAVGRLTAALHRKFGGTLTFTYDKVGGFAVDNLPAPLAAKLALEPGVAYVEPNVVLYPQTVQVNPGPGLDRIDQANLPLDNSFSENYDGAGVNVYILDTGVDTTVGEFAGRVGVGKTCVSQGGPYQSVDDFGHGTAVASVAVGTTYGVAKHAILHSVRISGDFGHGTSTSAIMTCGINWVASFGVKPAVASMSFGGIPDAFAVRDAINNVTITANFPFVKSAGNDSTDAWMDRGNRSDHEWVAGATDPRNDLFASFSNYGTTANFSVGMNAPGVNVLVADKWNPGFSKLASGTSFAAPYIAGVIAQYLQTNPTASNITVWDAMNNFFTTYGVVQGLTGVRAGNPNKLLRSVYW